MRVRRPTRPARSLQDFRILFTGHARIRNGSRSYVDSPKFWPCIKCHCGGRVLLAANRVELSVNGQRLPKETCEACGGSGEGTKETVKAFYDKEVREYRVALADYREGYKHWREALAKLTRKEKQAIQRFGLPVRKRRGVNVWTI